MVFPVRLAYNETSRVLKEIEGSWTLRNSKYESKIQYFCEIQEETDNLIKMEIEPDFHFLSPEDVEIIGITPLARMFMKNLLLYDDKYDNISDSNVYLMENSVLYKYDTKFNITGQIDDSQPKLENKSIVLMINLLSHEGNSTKADANCNFNEYTGNNYYILNCSAQEEFEGNLQFSTSFFDNGDILLIFFQDSNMSNIDIHIDTNKQASRRYYKKILGELMEELLLLLL